MAASDLTLVAGETRDVYMILADRDGPVPAGTYDSFTYRLKQGGTVVATASVTYIANGRVKVAFNATSTATPGRYSGTVRATRANSTFAVFPSERSHSVNIRED